MLNQNGAAFIIVQTVFTIVAIAAVILRFYARRLTRHGIQSCDYLLVAGLVMTIATSVVGYLMITEGGAGYHQAELSRQQRESLLKLFIAAPVVWAFATTAIKLSILSFYLSLFVSTGVRRAIYATVIISVLCFCLTVIEPFVQCRPFRYTWDKTIPGSCADMQAFLIAIAALNLTIDVTIFCFPVPILWSLQMDTRKKVYISLILLLGLVVCAMSALRIKALLQLDPSDFSYTIVVDIIYGGLEVTLGTTNACLPFFRPLLKLIPTPAIFSRQTQSALSSDLSSKPDKKPLNKGPSRENIHSYPLHVVSGEDYVVDADLMGRVPEEDASQTERMIVNESGLSVGYNGSSRTESV